jgi:type IV pilus assembly protein PilB
MSPTPAEPIPLAPMAEIETRIDAALSAVAWDSFVLSATPMGTRSISTATHGMPPPSSVRTLLQILAPEAAARVLHVGTGTGYIPAVISRLVAEVYSIERLGPLHEQAQRRLQLEGLTNIHLRKGDGFHGWPGQAPFDAILVTASVTRDPAELLDQLKIGGHLVMVAGAHRDRQTVVRYTRKAHTNFAREELREVRLNTLLGDILVELGSATRDDVERAVTIAAGSGKRLGEELSRLTQLEEGDIFRALAIQRGLRFGDCESLVADLDPELVEQVPRTFLEHNEIVPVDRPQKGVVRIATCNPDLSTSLLTTAFPACSKVRTYLVTPTDYRRLWSALDLRSEGKVEDIAIQREDEDILGRAKLDARFIALFDAMLLDAVAERASDVHLERYSSGARVRLRVDGELRDLERYKLTAAEQAGLVNVIKIRANMDIAERRRPQGGRIPLRAAGSAYDLRVQTQPSLHGEHVVVRLLPQDMQLITIEGLGFPSDIAGQYRRLIDSPAGLVLVVGPTGSGKSTTLYGGLQVLADQSSRKVITVEDPIEYSIDRIQQTQVNRAVSFNFANAMRSFVRQDPDVILVGEIRDGETALEAIRASQTGHLVLSTLHSNDCVDAVQRLYDLGMHPNSIASELLAVIGQRLAKRVCEHCREPAPLDHAILHELFPDGAPPDFHCFKGAGCRRCAEVGTRGRIAVVEFLRTNPVVRGAIARTLPLDDLRRVALAAGLKTMRENAIMHVLAGDIPLSELPRILPAERMAPEEPLTPEEIGLHS